MGAEKKGSRKHEKQTLNTVWIFFNQNEHKVVYNLLCQDAFTVEFINRFFSANISVVLVILRLLKVAYDQIKS